MSGGAGCEVRTPWPWWLLVLPRKGSALESEGWAGQRCVETSATFWRLYPLFLPWASILSKLSSLLAKPGHPGTEYFNK